MAVAPRDLVVGPLDVYLAPVGESFPAVNATPSGNWALLGTNGDDNYGDDGLTLNHDQTIDFHRTVGSTGPRKATRSEENLTLGFVLEDLMLEEYAKILNDVVVNTDAGPPSISKIGLRQGPDVSRFALLGRGTGMSPYGAFNMQLEVPIVVQSGNPAPVFTKNDVAGLQIEFTALEDTTAATDAERFGRWVAQDA